MRAEKLDTEIRQGQLARAALKLIAHSGLKALSVARVARSVGLVPSAVYRHFGSKDDLLDAVLKMIRERLYSNVSAVREQSPNSLDRLHRLLVAHITVIRENEGILRVVFSDEVHQGHPDRKAKIYEMVRGYLKKVAEIVSDGQREGQIRPDIDPDTVAVMFLGLIQPAAILWHLSNGGIDITRQAEKAWDILSCALKPE